MRLIDVDAAYRVLTDYYHHRTEIQHEALKEALSKVPTVDAVEVVQCKECRWFYDCRKDGWGRCGEHDDYGRDSGWWQATDFCSWGERREDVKTDCL